MSLNFFFFGFVGSSFLCAGFLWLRWVGTTLHCSARASSCSGFSWCRAWALGAQASVDAATQAQELWHMALCVPWHVESSWTRDRTHIPCIVSWILIHYTTREVLHVVFKETACGLLYWSWVHIDLWWILSAWSWDTCFYHKLNTI